MRVHVCVRACVRAYVFFFFINCLSGFLGVVWGGGGWEWVREMEVGLLLLFGVSGDCFLLLSPEKKNTWRQSVDDVITASLFLFSQVNMVEDSLRIQLHYQTHLHTTESEPPET